MQGRERGPAGAHAESKAFSQALQQDYGKTFAANQTILAALNKSLTPIIDGGISQYGLSNAEDSALRTQATAGTEQQYQNAKHAVGQAQAAQGGGDTFLPTGAAAANATALARAASQQESGQQLDITQQGRQNFMNAVNAQQGVTAGYNPLGYVNAASSATEVAGKQANQISELNMQASPWGAAGGILGGVAGQFAGGWGAQIAKGLGGGKSKTG